jgi:hypothetical protein
MSRVKATLAFIDHDRRPVVQGVPVFSSSIPHRPLIATDRVRKKDIEREKKKEEKDQPLMPRIATGISKRTRSLSADFYTAPLRRDMQI